MLNLVPCVERGSRCDRGTSAEDANSYGSRTATAGAHRDRTVVSRRHKGEDRQLAGGHKKRAQAD